MFLENSLQYKHKHVPDTQIQKKKKNSFKIYSLQQLILMKNISKS